MKNTKLIALSLTLLVVLFQSCQKSDIPNETDTENSTDFSITTKTIVSNLSGKIIDSEGTETGTDLSKILTFDFCFDFVFPITLQNNSGSTINVSNENQLLTIVLDNLPSDYIDGIAFPFQVESDGNTVTISTEAEFENLISNCDLDNDGIENYLDNDGDGDGIDNDIEDLNEDGISTNDDSDNDGNPNYLDIDDDGDGVNTQDEDADHNGDSADDDSDDDGIPNYLDNDSDNDGIEDGDDTDADGDGTNDDEEENDDEGDGDGD